MAKTIEIFFNNFEIESGIKSSKCMELEDEGFSLEEDYNIKLEKEEGIVYVYKKITI